MCCLSLVREVISDFAKGGNIVFVLSSLKILCESFRYFLHSDMIKFQSF